MIRFLFILLGCSSFVYAQTGNDGCNSAESLCGGTPLTGNTAGASSSNGEDGTAGLACFPFEKTVWYSFSTNNTGGNVSVNVTNVNCTGNGNNLSGIIYQPGTPCDASTYNVVSNCETGSTVGFSLTANGLAPNGTFYVLITSGKDCSFDIEALGPGLSSSTTPSVSITDNTGGTVCEQTPVTFTANVVDCATPTYDWLVNGVVVSTTNTNTYTTSTLTNGDNVQVEANCACAGTPATSNSITMSTFSSVADAGSDAIIPGGGSTVLNGSGGTTPLWTPADGLSDPTSYSPNASPQTTTTYTLTVTDGNGCTFSDSVTVTVVDTIIVPNTFTPNGDGFNDTWEILRVASFPTIKITVYDRWGQEVYKTIGYPTSKQWDGTKGESKLPASTYYYIIDPNNDGDESKLVTGSVTIVY